MERELEQQLEALVDVHGAYAVANTLAEIAHAKAEHVLTNWQDRRLARAWERAGNRLNTAASHISELALP